MMVLGLVLQANRKLNCLPRGADEREECKRDWDWLIGTIYFSRHCWSVQGVLKDSTQTNATASNNHLFFKIALYGWTWITMSFVDCTFHLSQYLWGCCWKWPSPHLARCKRERISLGREDLWVRCSWWSSPRPPIVERENGCGWNGWTLLLWHMTISTCSNGWYRTYVPVWTNTSIFTTDEVFTFDGMMECQNYAFSIYLLSS